MSEKTNNDPAEQPQLSPEEYKKLRDEAIKGLREEIKYLKVEEEYERLSADIEEHKTRRYTMIGRQAQMFAPPPEQPQAGEPQEENVPKAPPPESPVPPGTKPERKLKTN